MAQLIYSTLASLDGFIADGEGRFDWAAPDEEVHAFINNLGSTTGTFLFGRRMYEVMSSWEDVHEGDDHPRVMLDFAALWRAADKVVYSSTLQSMSTARTRIERNFEPEEVREMKAQSARDLAIAGPHLAAHAFRAALVDEIHLYAAPVIVGGGIRAFPEDLRFELELIDERRFGNGMIFLRYRILPLG